VTAVREGFLPVLNMSLTAGFVIVAVLIARLLLKRAPKTFSYALWAVVLFRLLCPLSIGSAFSIIPTDLYSGSVISAWSDDYIGETVTYHDNLPEYDTAVAHGRTPIAAGEGGRYVVTAPDGVSEPDTVADTVIPVLSRLWLWGILAMLAYSAVSLIRLRRKLVGAVFLRENIYLADRIATPFVIGVIRPKIYLPSTLSEQEQRYIILHEQTHLRRLDHIVRLFSFLALCIHWFNPLVWLAFMLSGKDMEMSCDEAVIKKLGGGIRADYSASLLSLSTGRRIIVGMPLAFGEGNTKGRIKNVLNYKKPALWIIIAAIIVTGAVAVCLLSNPLESRNDEISTDDFIDFPYDTFGFADLPPKESQAYAEELTFTTDHTEFDYQITYGRSGLYVDVGLIAEDGMEYLDSVRGGSAVGTIEDIPAGTYQVIVRNNEKNLEYSDTTTETLNISGAVAFGYVQSVDNAATTDELKGLFSYSASDIEKIEFQNGNTGELVSYTGETEISDIVEHLNAFSYDKAEEVDSDGWTYAIRIWFKDGSDMQRITLMPSGASIDGTRYISSNQEYFPQAWLERYFLLSENVSSPEETVHDFFDAFENSDYESMQPYCTQECIDAIFNADDVMGMKWAKALSIEASSADVTEQDGEAAVFVGIEMEIVSSDNALYGSDQTSFFVILSQNDDGAWLIDRFITG
jgi:beta-lactamase regulating signal transducer with metallopeptidase domain